MVVTQPLKHRMFLSFLFRGLSLVFLLLLVALLVVALNSRVVVDVEDIPSQPFLSNYLSYPPRLSGEVKEAAEDVFLGRSVALVGPALSFSGKGFGPEIDSYDIVCRINGVGFSAKDYMEDYGSRTDVLFANLNPHLNFPLLRRRLLELREVSLVVSIRGEWNAQQNWFEMMGKDAPQLLEIHRHWGDELVTRLVRPSSGFMAAAFLLEAGVRELAIYGIDFYHSGYNRHIAEEKARLILNLPSKESHPLLQEEMRKLMLPDLGKWHPIQDEKGVFKRYILSDPRVKWIETETLNDPVFHPTKRSRAAKMDRSIWDEIRRDSS